MTNTIPNYVKIYNKRCNDINKCYTNLEIIFSTTRDASRIISHHSQSVKIYLYEFANG